jgi:probable F420-dependent oxidoreductase
MAEPDTLIELATRAERLGFYAIIESSDHVIVPRSIHAIYPYSDTGEYTDLPEDLEQLTTLSFLASRTHKIRLMTGIMVLPYRNPIYAAKALATIDYLSKGRLIVGVGVGWLKEEFDTLHLRFEERGAMADECIKVLIELWTQNDPRFDGEHHKFSNVTFSPKVVQKPHPPILVGGESRRAIDRAARLGDGWVPLRGNPKYPLDTKEQLQEKIDMLKEAARRYGRSPDELEVGFLSPRYELNSKPLEHSLFVGDAQKIANDVARLEKLGVSFVGLDFVRSSLSETMELVDEFTGKVLPLLS